MASPNNYDGGTTNVSYFKAKAIRHTVSANEESSGLAIVTFMENPMGSDDAIFVSEIKNSSNAIVSNSGVIMEYFPSSGLIYVWADSSILAENNVISVIGMKYV